MSKVRKAGKCCRRCGGSVVRVQPGNDEAVLTRKNAKGRTYYYLYWFRCMNEFCGSIYTTKSAKRWLAQSTHEGINTKITAQAKGERAALSGTFERFRKRSGWQGRVKHVLKIVKIKYSEGKFIAESAWINLTKEFQRLSLRDGDQVEFDALVTHQNGKVRLLRPTRVRRLVWGSPQIRLIKREQSDPQAKKVD